MNDVISKYQQGYRRMLVDLHIPDWDPAFLAQYDPHAVAEFFGRANLASAMIYCKSHAGLCYWPTRAGKMHANLRGRDVVGEMVAELRKRKIAVCAYYSIVFDNWAVETHPDWRQQTITGANFRGVSRYGTCCMNHPEYRAYEMAQLDDLLSLYSFDALFLDMIFWPVICGCDHCRVRFRAESGKEIPTIVDWTSRDWCEFQAARERWSSEFTAELAAKARALTPGIGVTHNLAPALWNWVVAQSLSASRHDTFVAGDLYGDRVEQLVVSKLMVHLSETRPAEFMTSLCSDLSDHVRLKSEEQMRTQAMAATAMSSGFLFIDAIDPAGTVNPGAYERVGRVFAATQPYEQFLGGEPIEDVAVYFSVDSQMDFAENGKPVASFLQSSPRYPHLRAVRGACRALARAHIPFGVITRRQLAEFGRFRVIILPDVLRMDRTEADALREFVRAGGRLYASRYTSLVETNGERHKDFLLSDIFGASFASEEAGAFIYLKPAEPWIAESIAPQKFLSARPPAPGTSLCGVPRIESLPGARMLATLTVPYGYPARGSVSDHQWASIHSSPPWRDLEAPTVVTNLFGKGSAVYSAAAIEASEAGANESLFVAIVRKLLGGEQSFGAEAHGAVWTNAFDQRDRNRIMMSFLNYQAELPALPTAASFSIRPPTGRRFTSLRSAPGGNPLPFEIRNGTLHARLDRIETLAMVIAEYE
ncbi:MAG: alpha-L-fucosidase [Candidatus Binataceae bacterium]